jgi:hypothetical protein
MHGKVGKETCRCFDGALLLLHLRLGSGIHGEDPIKTLRPRPFAAFFLNAMKDIYNNNKDASPSIYLKKVLSYSRDWGN